MLDKTLNFALSVLFVIFLILRFQLTRGTENSGKFYPIKQWFYYDAIETLSGDPLPEEEVAPCQSRYDGQIMVYGKATQERLEALKLFVVGAGAIGCEMLKNFAMMGVACGGVDRISRAEIPTVSRVFSAAPVPRRQIYICAH